MLSGEVGCIKCLCKFSFNHGGFHYRFAIPSTGCNTPTDQSSTTDGSSTGVTYVHWGKSNCPGQSLLVYAGNQKAYSFLTVTE